MSDRSPSAKSTPTPGRADSRAAGGAGIMVHRGPRSKEGFHMAIELNNRTKILAGVVVLAAAGAGAWFLFLEDFLSEPPPKAPAAKGAPVAAPTQADAG